MSHSRKKKSNARPSFHALWLAWYENKSPALHFALKFGALLALFYALFNMPFFDRLLYVYLKANAALAANVLNALGQQTRLDGVTILSPRFSMAIRRGCDAVEPTWLFCAAILSFHAGAKTKWAGILTGIIILQTLNILRIISLYWIGIHRPDWFHMAHLELWPAAFILAAISLFIGWIEWTANQDK